MLGNPTNTALNMVVCTFDCTSAIHKECSEFPAFSQIYVYRVFIYACIQKGDKTAQESLYEKTERDDLNI